MNGYEKNALLQHATNMLDAAVDIVWFSVPTAQSLVAAVAGMLAQVYGPSDDRAKQAGILAAECSAIALIPFPFSWIAIGVWRGGVYQLRSSLTGFAIITAETEMKKAAKVRQQEEDRRQARERWAALSPAQRAVLSEVKFSDWMLRSLTGEETTRKQRAAR